MSFTDTYRSTTMISASETDVPVELQSNTLRRPVPSSVTTTTVNSNTGSQSAGGFSLIQIGSGGNTGVIKPSTAYLKFSVVCVGGTWCWQLATRSASAMIRQLTLSIGSNVIEQINNYDVYHDTVLLSHATSRNYVESDSAIMSGSSLVNLSYTAGTKFTFIVPLALGCFNSTRAFPLYLLNSAPLQLQIDWNGTKNAFKSSAALTETTISDVSFTYDAVTLDESFKQAVKMRMADPQNPALYQLEFDTVLANRTSNSPAVNLNLGTNMSSLKAVLYSNITENTIAAGSDLRTAKNDGENYDFSVFLDGRLINNNRISTSETSFVEMNKALGNAFDPTLTSVMSALSTADAATTSALATYKSNFFLGGVSCVRFSSTSNAMVGSPCSVLQIIKTAANHIADTSFFYMIVHSNILAIDAMGNSTLIR